MFERIRFLRIRSLHLPHSMIQCFPTGAISLSKRSAFGRSFENTKWVFVL